VRAFEQIHSGSDDIDLSGDAEACFQALDTTTVAFLDHVRLARLAIPPRAP
jgi:hypothetical protein